MRATFDRRGPLAIAPFAWGMDYEIVQPASPVEPIGGIAIVMVMGPLSHHGDWWGGDTYDAIEDRVRAALATSCDTVVMKFDSPGGEVDGAFECSRTLRRMAVAAGKRLIAYVDETATSAAYALACAAEAIYMPASGRCGSIGVISMVVDATGADTQDGLKFSVMTSGARKTDGNPHVPITDEARAYIQAEVDGFALMFFDLVAESRGIPRDAVVAQQAAIFRGADAVAAKLADGIANWDQLLAMLAGVEAEEPAAPAATPATSMEESPMSRKEMLAALKAMLAEDAPAPKPDNDEGGEDMSAEEFAKECAALFAEDDQPPHKEPDGDEGPAPEKPSDNDGDEDKMKSKATAQAQAPKASDDPMVQALALAQEAKAELAAFKAQIQTDKDNAERDAMLAARRDLSDKARAMLATKPLAYVRDALELIPVVPVSNPSAAAQVNGTRGEGQNSKRESNNPEMDRLMGLSANVARKPYNEGASRVFPVLTVEMAREAAKTGGAQ